MKELNKMVNSVEPLIILDSKKMAKMFATILLKMSKEGYTLKMILYDFNITLTQWKKAYKKYKVLRVAVIDAQHFLQAYGQVQLKLMAEGKISHSRQVAKLFMSNFYDITEEPENKDDSNVNKKDYNVKLTFAEEVKPEEVDGE